VKVGLDVIEIDRVRRALDRYPGFRERCFTEAERAYCDSRANPAQPLQPVHPPDEHGGPIHPAKLTEARREIGHDERCPRG